MSCEVRSRWSPMQSLTSPDQAYLQSLDEDCISHLATHPVRFNGSFKGIDMVKSWPGPGQKYNLSYSTILSHPVSL